VKITQVGSQSHLIAGSTPSASSLASVFSSLVATGVDVAITELDIRMTLPATAALLAQQKKDYNAVILACMQTPRCVGVTIWAYSDFYSWIPGVFPGWVSTDRCFSVDTLADASPTGWRPSMGRAVGTQASIQRHRRRY
jgi:GH35 family endo-1,4-beta-xylanase